MDFDSFVLWNSNCFDFYICFCPCRFLNYFFLDVELLQKVHHKLLDSFFSVLSCVVSVPFYTGFLPLLFWSGHSKLARQMTLLMAFCDYLGNSVKVTIDLSYNR